MMKKISSCFKCFRFNLNWTIDNKTLNSIIPKALFIDKKKIPTGYTDDAVAFSLWDQFIFSITKLLREGDTHPTI